MASLWSGVKLQDVKTQLALRGHHVPDSVIVSFLREAASSSNELPSSAACLEAGDQDSESDTESSQSDEEQAQEEAALHLAKTHKTNLGKGPQSEPVSAATADARHEDILGQASEEEASP